MKKRLVLIVAAVMLLFAGFFGVLYNTSQTSDQKNIKEIFGDPQQFVIAYLPRGEDELVRSESWYYTNAGKKIDFLGGKFVSESNWLPDGEVAATELLSEYFDFRQSLDDVEEILGNGSVEELDYFPAFYSEDGRVKTYYSKEAIFVMEEGYLTYFQTLGVGDKSYYDNELSRYDPLPTATPEVSQDFKNYISSDLGFEIKYPTDWFLEYGVLSSYDTEYLEKGLILPEKRLKCDFFEYNLSDVEIGNKVEIITGEIKVSKGTGVTKTSDGLGLGDAVMFLIEKEEQNSMSLLCYSYDSEFENKLMESLKTFRFLE